MWPDRVSNLRLLVLESDTLPTVLRCPAFIDVNSRLSLQLMPMVIPLFVRLYEEIIHEFLVRRLSSHADRQTNFGITIVYLIHRCRHCTL